MAHPAVRVARILCILAFLVPSAATAAPGTRGTDAEIAWRPSGIAALPTRECSEFAVPLDYDEPNGATISVAVVRVPATDQARRIGSLITNPGGPGGSGVEGLALMYAALPEPIAARFDFVGFDPRGVGQSAPVRCFASIAERTAFFAAVPSAPSGPRRWQLGSAPPRTSPSAAGSATPRPCRISRRRTWRGTWTACGRRSATTG